jgi:hypothetical protein
MEGEEPLQPTRRRGGFDGVEAKPGELGAGTGNAQGFGPQAMLEIIQVKKKNH